MAVKKHSLCPYSHGPMSRRTSQHPCNTHSLCMFLLQVYSFNLVGAKAQAEPYSVVKYCHSILVKVHAGTIRLHHARLL